MNYNFYLFDTLFVGNDSIFAIRLLPKRSYDKVFKGLIFIESSNWALKRVDLRMNTDPNINFVEDIQIRQEYDNIQGHWMPVIRDVQVDFKNGEKAVGLIGRNATFMRDIVLDDPKPNAFYKGEAVELKDDAFQKDSTFWKAERYSQLERSDQLAYEFIEDLQKQNIWKVIQIISEIITIGKKRWGMVDIGPYSRLFSFNRVEGFRNQLGVYTNESFSDRWYLGGHVAYGYSDSRFKYEFNARYKISHLPRLEVGVFRTEEVSQVGLSNFSRDGRGLVNSVLMRVPLTKLNYFTETTFNLRADPTKGVMLNFYLKDYSFEPAFPYYFIDGDRLRSAYQTTEIGVNMRLSFKERFVVRKRERIYTGSDYPVVYVDYAHGLKGFLGGDFQYDKLQISLTSKIKLGRFGWTNYTVQAGQIWGTLPYASLYVFQGSQSYAVDPIGYYLDAMTSYVGSQNLSSTLDPVTFNLQYFYEFVGDKYLVAGFDHHFEGWIFNKLPGLRWVLHKLKLKELVTARMGVGSISPANYAMNAPEADTRFSTRPEIQKNADNLIHVQSLNRAPYYELGCGVENIAKIFRVDFIWRMSYHTPTPPKSLQGYNYNFGLRFYATLAF